jgi:hypothetical protein
MNAKNEILEELRMLSAVVKDISRETPYRVPAGYFDGFPALMLGLTGEAVGTQRPFFATEKDKSLGFKDISLESKDFPLGSKGFSLESKDIPPTFSVPEGYFEGFAQGLLDKIKAGDQTARQLRDPGDSLSELNSMEGASEELARLSPFLNGISRKLPYQTPEGYFEDLSPIMAPLAEVREKPLYGIPEDYFEDLAGEILSKVDRAKVKEPARVLSLSPGQRSWWKYSAAAVVAGLIFTIGWLRLHTPTNTHRPTPAADVASNLVKISDQDLQSFLDDQNDQNPAATETEPVNSTATLDITDSDVKSLLGDVPDGELKSYMEEHGGANDIATN